MLIWHLNLPEHWFRYWRAMQGAVHFIVHVDDEKDSGPTRASNDVDRLLDDGYGNGHIVTNIKLLVVKLTKKRGEQKCSKPLRNMRSLVEDREEKSFGCLCFFTSLS